MTPELAGLATVIDLLNRRGIPYMLTGSVAASAHGRPRSTHDADVVIDPTRQQLDGFVADLDDRGFYVSADAARSALARRGQFNVIETAHASKIDLIIKKTRPFSVEEFGRRVPMDLPVGRDVSVVTAEDSILSKLEWPKMSSGSTPTRRCRGNRRCGSESRSGIHRTLGGTARCVGSLETDRAGGSLRSSWSCGCVPGSFRPGGPPGARASSPQCGPSGLSHRTCRTGRTHRTTGRT